MDINIHYHDDLDGFFSALFIAKGYKDNKVKAKLNFYPINYDSKDWQITPFTTEGTNVVVDFKYKPGTDLWFDHHLEGWGQIEPTEFKGSFISDAPSCCQVIFDSIERLRMKDEQKIKSLLIGINKVDQAAYDSAEEPFNLNKWFSAMRLSFLEDNTTEYKNELFKLFLNNEPAFNRLHNNVIPDISSWRAAQCYGKMQEGFKVFKEIYKYDKRIVHFTKPPYTKIDRYFPFRAEKDAMYTVYAQDFSWTPEGKAQVSVAKNPWAIKDPQINICDICSKYNGGGHHDVGGIPCASMEEAEIIKNEVVEYLSSTIS